VDTFIIRKGLPVNPPSDNSGFILSQIQEWAQEDSLAVLCNGTQIQVQRCEVIGFNSGILVVGGGQLEIEDNLIDINGGVGIEVTQTTDIGFVRRNQCYPWYSSSIPNDSAANPSSAWWRNAIGYYFHDQTGFAWISEKNAADYWKYHHRLSNVLHTQVLDATGQAGDGQGGGVFFEFQNVCSFVVVRGGFWASDGVVLSLNCSDYSHSTSQNQAFNNTLSFISVNHGQSISTRPDSFSTHFFIGPYCTAESHDMSFDVHNTTLLQVADGALGLDVSEWRTRSGLNSGLVDNWKEINPKLEGQVVITDIYDFGNIDSSTGVIPVVPWNYTQPFYVCCGTPEDGGGRR